MLITSFVIEKTRDNTYINSSFLNVNYDWNGLKFDKLWASFRP